MDIKPLPLEIPRERARDASFSLPGEPGGHTLRILLGKKGLMKVRWKNDVVDDIERCD